MSHTGRTTATMNHELREVFAHRINLYQILKIPVTSNVELQSITLSQIRKQYRKLALDYHPDKNFENIGSETKFHEINLATTVLCDDLLKKTYDEWFSIHFLCNDDRLKIVHRLQANHKEQVIRGTSENRLHKIQEHGQLLRKLKYFNKSYGNWKDFVFKEPDKHHLSDTCTLRLELKQTNITRNEISLKKLVTDSNISTYDIYYSMRNRDTDDYLVVYVILNTVDETLELLSEYKEKSPLSEYILSISPSAPIQDFRFEESVNLDPHIIDLMNNTKN